MPMSAEAAQQFQSLQLILDSMQISVGVVPNSLHDISRASDGEKRRLVTGGLGRRLGPFGIYTLARVSWRLDSLVSRHRRVTQNS